MIRFYQVWHHYSVKPVLRGIDLEVRPGELFEGKWRWLMATDFDDENDAKR